MAASTEAGPVPLTHPASLVYLWAKARYILSLYHEMTYLRYNSDETFRGTHEPEPR
jgi:hypothetical protein